MNDIIKELNRLKSNIDDSKTQIAILTDRKEEALRRLRVDHGLKDLTAAEKWLERNKLELEKQEKLIRKSFEKLNEQYKW